MNGVDVDIPFQEDVDGGPPAVAVNREPPEVAPNPEPPALAVSFPSAALLNETNRLQSKCISSHLIGPLRLSTPISSLPSCQFPVSSKQLQDESSYPV